MIFLVFQILEEGWDLLIIYIYICMDCLYYPFIVRSSSKTGEDKKKAKGDTGLSHSLFGSVYSRYACSHCKEKYKSHTHTHTHITHNRNLTFFLKTITMTYLMTH